MKILITGICGFAGSALATGFKTASADVEIFGVDNLSRPGSHINRGALAELGIRTFHGDIRQWSDVESLPRADWVIDAAAQPSVLAGVDGTTSSRQLLEHNLFGTVNLLEYAKRHTSGLILLSTSRVYSIKALCEIPLKSTDDTFLFDETAATSTPGLSALGSAENFPTTSPISVYGATKLCSEMLIEEYGAAYNFPVWINRCGVLAGAGQFGRPDQGIFSFWINSYLRKRPLKYIGFGGSGFQVRDCLHPRDLVPVLSAQMADPKRDCPRIMNFAGGVQNSMSLKQLSKWCEQRFGAHEVAVDKSERPFDVPWVILDSSLAKTHWHWQPQTGIETVLDEIAQHAAQHPDWLAISNS